MVIFHDFWLPNVLETISEPLANIYNHANAVLQEMVIFAYFEHLKSLYRHCAVLLLLIFWIYKQGV